MPKSVKGKPKKVVHPNSPKDGDIMSLNAHTNGAVNQIKHHRKNTTDDILSLSAKGFTPADIADRLFTGDKNVTRKDWLGRETSFPNPAYNSLLRQITKTICHT